jgi:drug/metabolite transporter (DMT)-like permease
MKTAVLIVLTTIIWGYTWSVMKVALDYFPPMLYATLRLGIGAVGLLGLLVVLNKSFWPAKTDWKPLTIMGLWMSAGFFGLLTYAMQFVSSGETAVLVYTMPIMVSILAHFLLGERLHRWKVLGLFSGAAGLLMIIGAKAFNLTDWKSLMGQAIILVAAFCWSMANIYSKQNFGQYDKIKMTAWQMFIGTSILLFITLWVEDVGQARWNLESLGILIFTGFFSSAFAFVAWFWVLDRIPASTATMTLMTVPVLGVFFGWLHLGEAIPISTLLGVLFIIGGIGLVSLRFKPHSNPVPMNRTM